MTNFSLFMTILSIVLNMHSKAPDRACLKTTVYFFNSDRRYPIGTNEQLFWMESEYHDTLIINDKTYNRVLDNKFKALKDTGLYEGIDDLRVGAAFIREYNDTKVDTFYSSPDLTFWKKKDNYYVDKTGFFKRTFSSFFLYE